MEPLLTMVIRSGALVSGVALAAWLAWAIVHASLAPKILLPAVAGLVGLTLVRPIWGVFAVAAIVPLLGRFVDVFGTAHFVPAEVLFYAAFGGWLLHVGVRGGDWRPAAVDPWMLMWGLVIGCSAAVELKAEAVQVMPGGWMQRAPDLFTGYPHESPLYFLRAAFTYCACMAAFVFVGQSVREDRDRERLVRILTAASVVVCAYAVYQVLTGANLHLGVSVQSTLTDKATLGGYFALMTGLVLGQTRSAGWSRAAGYLLLAVCAIGLWCSQSGNAWLAVSVLLLIIGVVKVKGFRHQPRRMTVVQLVVLLLVVVVLAVGIADNVETRIERGHLKRPLYWMASFDALWNYPVWGVGVGGVYTMPYTPMRGVRQAHAHNDLLHIGTELGLVGMAAWLVLLGVFGREAWRKLRGSRPDGSEWARISLLLGAMSFLLAGFGENLLGYVEQQLLFGSVMGAMAHPGGRRAGADVWWFAVGVGLVLLLSVWFRQPLA